MHFCFTARPSPDTLHIEDTKSSLSSTCHGSTWTLWMSSASAEMSAKVQPLASAVLGAAKHLVNLYCQKEVQACCLICIFSIFSICIPQREEAINQQCHTEVLSQILASTGVIGQERKKPVNMPEKQSQHKFPWPGIESGPWRWERQILATRPSGTQPQWFSC